MQYANSLLRIRSKYRKAWHRQIDNMPGFSSNRKGVPRTGFEPVISTLKGWHPRPLDERGIDITALHGRQDCTLLQTLCQATIGRKRNGYTRWSFYARIA